MSGSKAEHEHQLDTLMEARELFMDAEFDQAMAKFKEAGTSATAAKHWLDLLAAETGQAEVLIQKRDWPGAADLLKSALAAAAPHAGDADGLRDLIRARFMSGVALLGQRKATEAAVEFEAARALAESADEADAGPASCRGYLPDIQDRLEDIDKEVEEDDLLEIAIEFGVTPQPEDDSDDDEEEEEEIYCEEEEDDDEAEAAAVPRAQKRPAAAAPRANGNDDDEEEDSDDEAEESEEEEDEEEAEEAVPLKRSRMSTGGRRPAAAAGAAVSGKGDEEEESDDEEVSSSA